MKNRKIQVDQLLELVVADKPLITEYFKEIRLMDG